MSFEIKHKDLAARIGELSTNHGIVETPMLMPVVNPNFQVLDERQMTKAGAQIVITNSYILWKNHSEEVQNTGVHDFINFKKPVMTDSGAFQLMEYGDIEVTNREIIEFQKKIDVDIGVLLDIPTLSIKKETVKESVEKSIERAKEAQEYIDKERLWCGPIQGASYPELVEKSAKEMGKLDFDLYAVGSVVPLMVRYEFEKVIDALATAKMNLPAARPIHLFGAGHPMFFAFACAFGADLFDSAAYFLYAKDGRYLTISGTEQISELNYLPCNCPICSQHTIKEISESQELLALHNLYASFEEINVIKQAIRDNTLWELLEQRSMCHPKLGRIFNQAKKHKELFLKNDPLTKKHLFYLSENTLLRPEFTRTKEMAKKIKSEKIKLPYYGSIPKTLIECYPFSQTIGEEFELKKEKNLEKTVRDVSKYWFRTDIFPKAIKGEVSRKTRKLRFIKSDTKLLCAVNATDFRLLLHEGAKYLHQKTKDNRIVMQDDAIKFIKDGKSAFCKFVESCDKKIIPGQEVLIVDKKDNLIASGEALLSADEILTAKKGVAARIRWINK